MKPQAGNNSRTASFPFTFPPCSPSPSSICHTAAATQGGLGPHLTSILLHLLTPLSEASRTEGHRESLSTSEKRLILFAPSLTGPLILQVYLSSEHLAPLTTWPALLSAALLSRAGLGPASVTVSNYGTAHSHRKCELLIKWLTRSLRVRRHKCVLTNRVTARPDGVDGFSAGAEQLSSSISDKGN